MWLYTCSIDSRGCVYAYSLPRGEDFFPIHMGKPVSYKRKAVSSRDTSQFTSWCHMPQHLLFQVSQPHNW